jgi:hypothetical protein
LLGQGHYAVIEVIYANGCSFTAGSELENENPALARSSASGDRFDPGSPLRRYQKEHAWPAVLGTILGARRVVNEARGGGSNARAVRLTIDFVSRYLASGARGDRLLVALGLTDPARHERFASECPQDGGREEEWRLLKPALSRRRHGADRWDLACNRAYYGRIHNEHQAARRYVEHVLVLQAVCDRHGVGHHLHDALTGTVESIAVWQRPLQPALDLLWSERHRSLTRIGGEVGLRAGRAFEDWVAKAGVPTGPGGHPLSAGHRGWAQELSRELRMEGLFTAGPGEAG